MSARWTCQNESFMEHAADENREICVALQFITRRQWTVERVGVRQTNRNVSTLSCGAFWGLNPGQARLKEVLLGYGFILETPWRGYLLLKTDLLSLRWYIQKFYIFRTANFIIFSDLTPGRSYLFAARAENSDGYKSAFSDDISCFVPMTSKSQIILLFSNRKLFIWNISF